MTSTSIPASAKIEVSIILVTYNSSKDIKNCLQSIIDQEGVSKEIIIIDNNSSDGTNKIISDFLLSSQKQGDKKSIPNTSVIQNQENIGFPPAANQAVNLARGKYVYIFNPDAKFLKSTDLVKLVQYAQNNPQLGLVGSKIIDSNGVESKPQYSYPNEKFANFDSSQLPGKVAWLLGASMLILTKVFEEIGGLDSHLFLYIDDVDLCLRLRQKGLEIGYYPDVVIEHIGSVSADQLPSYDKKVLKTKARYWFCKKHYQQEHYRNLLMRDKARAEKRCRYAAMFGVIMPSLKRKLPVYQAVRDVASGLLKQSI